MTDFEQRAVDSAFRRLGNAAVFRPEGGVDVPGVLVIPRQDDREASPYGVSVVTEATVIDVRASEVSAPKQGDAFVIGETVYTIKAQPRRDDQQRLVWTCPAIEGG